jgi:hypothetical protein
MYEILFDLNVNLCTRFPALDPFRVRAQRFHDVLLIFRRLNGYKTADERAGITRKNGVIRRPAKKDDWF